MGKKLLVVLAMEGEFTSDGLQTIDGDDDMLTAMARELVENRGIGESADSIWRRLCPATVLPSQQDSKDTAIVPAEVRTPERNRADRLSAREAHESSNCAGR